MPNTNFELNYPEAFESSADFAGAKGLVFLGKDNEFLVYTRVGDTKVFPDGCIDLPGGMKELSESPFETLKREAREEFGIVLEPAHLFFYFRGPSGNNPAVNSCTFGARIYGLAIEDVVFGDEGRDPRLVTFEEYYSAPIKNTAQVERVRMVEKYLQENHQLSAR